MTLVERLGFGTINNLYAHMSSNDIVEWMAYDLTQNTSWAEGYKADKDLKEQRQRTLEEETEAMKAMFSRMWSG